MSDNPTSGVLENIAASFPTSAKLTVATGAWAFSSMTLNEWATIATIIFVVAQTLLLIPKYLRWFKTGNPELEKENDDSPHKH